MFHEIYEVPAEINFYVTELNIQADVVCTTYQLDSDFKEVIRIHDPESALRKVDNRSIDLNFNYEVEIKNYATAKQGQMPTYDSDKGIRWIDPLNSHELDVKVEQARLYSEDAASNATVSANKAAEASMLVEQINNIVERIDNKFWFGTITDYNKLLVIDPNVIYVITT